MTDDPFVPHNPYERRLYRGDYDDSPYHRRYPPIPYDSYDELLEDHAWEHNPKRSAARNFEVLVAVLPDTAGRACLLDLAELYIPGLGAEMADEILTEIRE